MKMLGDAPPVLPHRCLIFLNAFNSWIHLGKSLDD